MRVRTLIAIVLTVFALPVLASELPPVPVVPANPNSKSPPSTETILAIADARLEAAFDEKTKPDAREALLDLARKGYQKALEQDPKSKAALNGMARYYARVGDRDKALEFYKKYLTLYPDADVAVEIATMYAERRDWSEAIAWCRYAQKLDPENLVARKLKNTCTIEDEQELRPSAYSLKRADAETVSKVVALFIRDKGPNARVTYDIADNKVFYSGPPDVRRQIRALIAVLDKEPIAVAPMPHEAPESTARAEEPKPLPLQAVEFKRLPTASLVGILHVTDDTVAVYKLKNVAATDAADALKAYMTARKMYARVVPEPVSNTVLIQTDSGLQKHLAQVLAELDKEPRQVVMQVMVVRVPRGFTERAGLNIGAEAGAREWTLSPREMHMLTELFRAAKEKGEIDVLTRPQIQVCDGQTGYMRVGAEREVVTGFEIVQAGGAVGFEPKKQKVPTGVALQLTPRVAPDGKSVMLSTDFTYVQEAGQTQAPLTVSPPGAVRTVTHLVPVPTFSTLAARATAELKFGHTLILAAQPERNRSLTGVLERTSDEKFETLVFITPDLVKSERDLATLLAADQKEARRNENVDTIYVPIANNRAFQTTPHSGLEADITREVIREIGKVTRYRVTSDSTKADTELLCNIVSVTKTVQNIDQQNAVREGEIQVEVDIVWRDLRTGTILSNPGRNSKPVRIVATGRFVPENGETSATAAERVQKQIAVKVVELMERPWESGERKPVKPAGGWFLK